MRYFIFSVILSLLLAAVFSFEVPQVEATLGASCGESSGKVSALPGATDTFTFKDASKDWIPATWVGATVKITNGAGAGESRSVETSTSNTITVDPDWDTGTLDLATTYTVFFPQNRCTEGGIVYSCKQTEERGGRCAGPCGTDAACKTDVADKLGWGGTKCSSTVGGGQCLELPKSQLTQGPQSGSQLLATVDTATNWVFAIFTVLAIIFVLLAAFQFVTAGGEAEKVGEARQKLIWAAVGIIVALLAKGLVPVVRSIIGG